MLESKRDRLCFFDFCGSNIPSSEQDHPVMDRLKSTKRIKTSLKRNNLQKSYGITQYHSKILSPPAYLQTRSSQPLYETRPIYLSSYVPVTPRPRISFSWKNKVSEEKQLDQTVKKPQKESMIDNEKEPECELDKTKPVKKLLQHLSDKQLLHKASVISIQDFTPKQAPKVEESVIMVDYFNPTKQQQNKWEEYIEMKTEREKEEQQEQEE